MKGKIDSKSLLNSRQLRSTPLREAILDVLHENERPLSVEQISSRMKRVEFDQASLFRSLKAMTEKDVINQIDLGEGFYRYEAHCEHHSHHHHIMCNSCKEITVLPFCIPPRIVKYLEKAGYSQLSHRMDFFGVCKSCSK